MKLFVVVSVALVFMFVLAMNTAAAPTDDEDMNNELSLPFSLNDIKPYARTPSSKGHYTKITSKNPLFIVIKTVVKLLTKFISKF